MVSRRDVAKEAGVSATSVSYYINKSGYVGEATGKRIQQAIETLNYNPNQIARSLKVKTSKQFVFLCNDIRNPFFSQLVHSATEEAYRQDYSILFSNVIDDEAYLRKLCSYQVGGMFVPSNKIRRSVVESVVKMGIPIIMFGDAVWQNAPTEITQIRSASEQVFPQIISHLKKNGYHSPHYISSALDANLGLMDDKAQAYLQATGLDHINDVTYNVASAEEAEQMLLVGWSHYSNTDAFLCTNDSVAQGVIHALSRLGVRVPQDVGIVGYDNTILSRSYLPTISTVDYGAEKLGEMIIQMLIQRVQGESVPNTVIDTHFISRQSTARLE